MKPYYEDDRCQIFCGDCREVSKHVAGVDAVLTDPPYGLDFMGKGWDHKVPGPEYWEAIAGSCKPGAMLLAFGGTRTWHRLTCAIEDAGWEIRDCLMWLYGSGFPKSLDVSKAIDKATGAEREVVGICEDGVGNTEASIHKAEGFAAARSKEYEITAPATEAAKQWQGWGTALKPAWEPIVLAMKALDGSFANNAVTHGVAGLNIDSSRIATDESLEGGIVGNQHSGYDRPWKHDEHAVERRKARGREQIAKAETLGRWPANVIHDGSEEVEQGFPDATSRFFKSCNQDDTQTDETGREQPPRTFYTSKASKADRGHGNDHPTVKPTDLIRYLLKLVSTPTGGVVFDPFMGSGSTLVAARIHGGQKAIGCDLDEHNCEIAAKRLAQGTLF